MKTLKKQYKKNTGMGTLRHEWCKLARYRILALEYQKGMELLIFSLLGKHSHSHMTSVELEGPSPQILNLLVSTWT
jgi:hypothetical protein